MNAAVSIHRTNDDASRSRPSPEPTPCYNPATGELVGVSPLDGVETVAAAVKRGRAVQPAWAALPLADRCKAILKVRDYIVAHADEIADTISKDNGKTRVDAMATEVLASAMAASYYAANAERFLAPKRLKPGNLLLANKISKIVRVPFGVIGIISPWNYPFAIPFSEVVMGLLSGNAVILKAASQTQLVGRMLERCFQAADLPEGIFTYLNLPGRYAGDALLESGINKMFFTGSVPIGKKLMAKAAETLTPVSLELGGNDPMLVCPDADLERATNGALWAGMQNAGQSCGGVERIYVHKDVYEPFLVLLAKKVRALRVGPDEDFNVDMGAMTTTTQVDTVRYHIDDAVAKGARVYAQSSCPKDTRGYFLPATVLVDVDHTMAVMREESFGPVVGVMKVESMEEAIQLANDSNLGLTASIWSRNWREAERIGRCVHAGAVTINDHLMTHGLAETPWGGFKESGVGRTHGELGFDEMTEAQVVVQDFLPGVKRNMWWYPHSRDIYVGIRGILELLYGTGVKQRFGGLLQLMKIFPRTFTTDPA